MNDFDDFKSWFQTTRNIYYGRVLDNNDPLMLGRVRVHPDHENLPALEGANQNFDDGSQNENNGKWSINDPLIFLPLLPYFVNQVPKVGERVLIIFFNNAKQNIKDRFYLVGPYSSPTKVFNEDFSSSRTHLNSGTQNDRIKYPNIKNLDGTYKNIENKGVYAEPEDVALKGRGVSDVIVKENDVLIRAGKHKLPNNQNIPIIDENRAFLQLSKFNTKTTVGEEETIFRLQKNDKQIKYLLEYDIYNPESVPQIFTGNITIYQLPTEQSQTKTSNFDYDTDLSGFTSSKIRIINIDSALNLEEFTKFISEQVVTLVNNPTLLLSNLPNGTTTSNKNDATDGIQFPFYYRPSKRIRNLLKGSPSQSSIDLTSYSNMQQFVNKIQVTTTDLSPGYGLVLDAKFSPEIPFEPKTEKYRKTTVESLDNTVAILGANSLFLLSNESEIPGKPKVEFKSNKDKSGNNSQQNSSYNPPNPSYKFESQNLSDNVIPSTSSMVRGEELLELLELIVGFLVSHVHPYPLLPPSSVAYDGTSTDELLKKMLEAYNKVLNKNIRIN